MIYFPAFPTVFTPLTCCLQKRETMDGKMAERKLGKREGTKRGKKSEKVDKKEKKLKRRICPNPVVYVVCARPDVNNLLMFLFTTAPSLLQIKVYYT